MSTIRRLHTLALALTLMLGALLAGAPLALAQVLPDPPTTGGGAPPATTPAVSHGAPLWLVIVVAVGTAAVSITATWLVSTRARQPRALSTSPA
jgi:hypothetical protein